MIVERPDELGQDVVTELRAIRLVIHDPSGRRIAVSGAQADLSPTDFAELGGTGLQEDPLELGEFVICQIEPELGRPGRSIGHRPIVAVLSG